MEQIRLKGRPAYPGKAAGEAIVCPNSIQGWAGVSDETGCIIEEGHPEKGKCIKGKILVIPYGKGSTGWSGHFHSAAVAGFSPAGWLFSNIDSRCGVATAGGRGFPQGPGHFFLDSDGGLGGNGRFHR